jgi:demethylmenaquinone methyltransferase/2-methoxy-6-polyprenyl-1,4-benzoquinol methylase
MILLSSERSGRYRRPRTASDLTARYDVAAAGWHGRMQRLGYPRAYSDLLDELRRSGVLHRRPPSPRVLDCGLGTGVLAAAFARAVPGVTTVSGVDLSVEMLHAAAASLAAVGVTAHLQRADARCLPYRDGEFDAVLCAHMLEHLPAPLVALGEMARVLRPGGLLIIVAVRATVVDAAIRLKWGHAPIRPDDLVRWMTLVSIRDVRSHALGSGWTPTRWLSRALVGRKRGARGPSSVVGQVK